MIKRNFNKSLIMSAEEEDRFQLSSSCLICNKLLCHIAGKYRGAAHWSCSINLELSKKIPVIFHNLFNLFV